MVGQNNTDSPMKKILFIIIMAISLSASAQSAFYQKCSQRKDVKKVAYFKNQKIDDIKVDITLVQAKDIASFRKILDEYGLKSSKGTSSGSLTICIRNNEDPLLQQPKTNGNVSLKNACLVGASESELTIYVFHDLRNKDRLDTIIQYILNKKMDNKRTR